MRCALAPLLRGSRRSWLFRRSWLTEVLRAIWAQFRDSEIHFGFNSGGQDDSKLGPSWGQVGNNLGPCWAKLALS
eukprot:1363528-Karenia_brevis.AAC.1